ncbi:uncharacterized protein BDZ99DRAFT_463864 [Mytilinidion resinicola]|uniref:Uncharacterized protein n=1 Tax=Mytilinidion resinicola TaxID=574789 RepID=A0A6A6YJR0_9PEZI|nr:uncharacterized protein BDZ99DRAFT_463864 [Mytilinidion resinicola]KAF2809030.1 hypothetical protein BDZ99DRAFT_463864 [Mytilinidion resinicola]
MASIPIRAVRCRENVTSPDGNIPGRVFEGVLEIDGVFEMARAYASPPISDWSGSTILL